MKTVFTVIVDSRKSFNNRVLKGEIEGVADNSGDIHVDVRNIATNELFKLHLVSEQVNAPWKVVNAMDEGGNNQQAFFEESSVQSQLSVSFLPVPINQDRVKMFFDSDMPESVIVIRSGYDFEDKEQQQFYVLRETPEDHSSSLMTREQIRSTFKVEV